MARIFFAILLAFALAGCSGSKGSDTSSGTDSDTSGTGSGTGSGSGSGSGSGTTTTTTTGSGGNGAPGPIFLNGTITGAADCSAYENDPSGAIPSASAETQDLTAAMSNRTYTLSLDSNTLPAGGSLCIFFDVAETTAGVIPDGATRATIMADGVVDGDYSLKIN